MVITSHTGMMKEPNKLVALQKEETLFLFRETLCLIVAAFAGDAEEYWAQTAIFCISLTVGIYALLWVVVWKKTSKIQFSQCT